GRLPRPPQAHEVHSLREREPKFDPSSLRERFRKLRSVPPRVLAPPRVRAEGILRKHAHERQRTVARVVSNEPQPRSVKATSGARRILQRHLSEQLSQPRLEFFVSQPTTSRVVRPTQSA